MLGHEVIVVRIGVIADTHIPGRARRLPAEVLEHFSGVDLILHAGDLITRAVLDELGRIAPVVAVAGNNDPEPLAAELGLTRDLNLAGSRIGLTHGHVGRGKSTVERALSQFEQMDCVVFGHSHIPYVARHGRTLAFNPGSPTDRRRSPHFSVGLLTIGPDGVRAEHRWW